ncbi:Small s protein [Lasiodiplodia theobromae]|uniref:Small s protein n=1 Tax=Lasiodiplodia theobromae TaxID=45133 RepID=UPI0015C31016|nr:Small s protein [Lasiodiplodia theobromae]KAF4536187.1 Small s protein [Lasiodiplodia theobromae]
MEWVSSTVNLFYLALDCLEHIQIAREFNHDFAKHQIKLDIIQIRLSRLGEVTELEGKIKNGQNNNNPTSPLERAVKKVLEDIRDLLDSFQEEHQKIKPEGIAPEAVHSADEMNDRHKRIRESLRHWVMKRKSQAIQTGHRIQWVFYKKTTFDKFVTDISDLLDKLEKLFPENIRNKLQDLSRKQCEDISKANLETLSTYIDRCDPWLKTAVEERLKSDQAAGVNINQSHNTGTTTGIHNGDMIGFNNGPGSLTNNIGRENR